MDYTFAELAEKLGIDPNNPTYEGQQKLKDWLAINQKSEANPNGYEPGDLTNKYLNTPTEPPQEDKPQDSVLNKWNPASAPWNRQEGGGTNSIDQVDQAIEADKQRQEEEKQAKRQNAFENMKSIGRDFRTSTSGIGNTLSAWTPVGITALGGRDRSGEATGYATQAAQNQYNAAQNEKLRQQNMQQAMDNTIADKMAAAEADNKAKQLANVKDEYGAMGLAGNYETSTPDLWKQKQLQNERRDVAAQNLAEVNRNKLMAIGNETNESMTNYATNVEDSQNAYKAALANAEGKAKAKNDAESKAAKPNDGKVNETPTTPSGDTTSTETNESQPADTTSTAPSNQESEGVESATNQVAIEDIIKQVEELNAKLKAGNAEPGMIDTYNELKSRYEALKTKVENPPAFPDMWLPSNDTDVSSIASAVDDLTL